MESLVRISVVKRFRCCGLNTFCGDNVSDEGRGFVSFLVVGVRKKKGELRLGVCCPVFLALAYCMDAAAVVAVLDAVVVVVLALLTNIRGSSLDSSVCFVANNRCARAVSVPPHLRPSR